MRPGHSIVLALLVAGPAHAQSIPAAATFSVFLGGRPIGTEQTTVEPGASGWTVVLSGRLGPPFNIITRRLEIRYDTAWKPQEMTLDAEIGGQPQWLHTTFAGTTATSELAQGGAPQTKTDQVTADTIVLPTPFFGAYEAVAARLSAPDPPSELRAYIVPQLEVALRVTGQSEERFLTGARPLDARRYLLTIESPGSPTEAELWTDASGRLLRFQIPAHALDVIREDIAQVSVRLERSSHPGDEQVLIPGYGFSLSATVTRPPAAETPTLPAVVLLGDASSDRDGVVGGAPILGDLAGRLADRGYLVVRYDKRGAGQSGGRPETVTLGDYAEDAKAVVKYLRDRRDVDRRRVSVVGHGEGGWVAVRAAAGNDDIRAVVTIGAGGTRGAELVMEQQTAVLRGSGMTQTQMEAALELQHRIMKAIIEDAGWDDIPPDMQRRADTPLYRSYLTFDPAAVAGRLSQPLLIVHGEADGQVPPAHADLLAGLARTRRSREPVEVQRLPALDHLLIDRARPGAVSPAAIDLIATWLEKAAPPRPR